MSSASECKMCSILEDLGEEVSSVELIQATALYGALNNDRTLAYRKIFGIGASLAFIVASQRPDLAIRFANHESTATGEEEQSLSTIVREVIEKFDKL